MTGASNVIVLGKGCVVPEAAVGSSSDTVTGVPDVVGAAFVALLVPLPTMPHAAALRAISVAATAEAARL